MRKQLLLPALMCSFLSLPFGEGGATHAQNPGSLDLSFDPGEGVSNGPPSLGFGSAVHAAVIQPDGKIIIGGDFNSYDGTTRRSIARLNADGTLDDSFAVHIDAFSGADGRVASAAIQPDGKIIIGGPTSYNGTAVNGIARLNADGTLDGSFNSGTGAGAGGVNTIAVQPDGKIIIGGSFHSYNGTASMYIARLNADGTLDGSFNVGGSGANDHINTIAVQPDGKIIIGGCPSYNGTAVNNITRLNADGTLDGSFNSGTGANYTPTTISIQPDGKIIIGGNFTSYDGTARNHIARLNANGTLDGSFNVGMGANNFVNTTTLQPDGRIIIGGDFTSYNGTGRDRLARLNADGTLDGSFTVYNLGDGTGVGVPFVLTTAIQSDGKIIIGGNFSGYGGTMRRRIARLHGGGSVGVDDEASSGFSVFPNPSSGLYTLALGEASGTVQINVTDITGREVHSEQFTATGNATHTIDLSGRANGVYSLRISTAQGTGGMRLVKEDR